MLFRRGITVGGHFLCKSWLFAMICPGSGGLGLKPRPLTSRSALFTQPHALSGVSLLSAKHHKAPRADKGGSASQTAGGGEVGTSDGGGISPFLPRCSGPATVRIQFTEVEFFFPLKIWPQCLGSSLCTIHSYSVLFCFIFKIKQTSSITWCQNKEASEHENKNYGPFHLRGESPSLDTSEPLDPGHPDSAFSLADESDVGREGRT